MWIIATLSILALLVLIWSGTGKQRQLQRLALMRRKARKIILQYQLNSDNDKEIQASIKNDLLNDGYSMEESSTILYLVRQKLKSAA